MSAIVGVDPSISSTGVAFVSAGGVGVLRVQSKPRGNELPEQLGRMRRQVVDVHAAVADVMPSLIVLEGPSFGSQSSSFHMLAGFWWLLAHALEKLAPIAIAAPATVKKYATGNGRASKEDMVAAAVDGFPQVRIRGNDEADALAMAAMGADRFGVLYVGGFPSAVKGSLAAVRWPEMKGTRG